MKKGMRALCVALLGALALGNTGCIKKILLDGQIEGTRKASDGVDTLSDYEVANATAFAGLGQFEGMHYLAPDNEDGLFLLTKGWGASTFAFIEDQLEQAEDAEGQDSPQFLYQQARTRAGYERAIYYGLKLLELRHPGFVAASKNSDTMKAWLANFADPQRDAGNLFWTGYAWMSKTNILQAEPAVVGELFIGVAMIERAVELDENYMNGAGHIILGAYHARPMGEMDEAKRHFDKALQINGGRILMTKLNYAAKYYCMKADKGNYERLLNEVLEAGDVFPEQRLSNVIAKRRAKRYLSKSRERNCGF
jgi:tetratricopeptide (TPR) repeat protein